MNGTLKSCKDQLETYQLLSDNSWPFLRRNVRKGQESRLGRGRTKQTHQKRKKNQLPLVDLLVIDMKKEFAKDCKHELIRHPDTLKYDGDSATFEFFQVCAPLLTGTVSAHFDCFLCITDQNGKLLTHEYLRSFAPVVNDKDKCQSTPQTTVYEYWIPKYRANFAEAFVVVRGVIVEQDEPAAEGAKMRTRRSLLKTAGEPTTSTVNHRGRMSLHNRKLTATASVPKVRKLCGIRSLGKWDESKELDVLFHGGKGVPLYEDVNNGSSNIDGIAHPTQSFLADILTKKKQSKGEHEIHLTMEVSNEHGYSDDIPPNKGEGSRSRKRENTKGSQESKSNNLPAVRYQIKETAGTLVKLHKDTSPLSDSSSAASSSSGYGTRSSASTSTTGRLYGSSKRKAMNRFATKTFTIGKRRSANNINLVARSEGLTQCRCVVCRRVFSSVDKLMTHLKTSYPALTFTLEQNVISVSSNPVVDAAKSFAFVNKSKLHNFIKVRELTKHDAPTQLDGKRKQLTKATLFSVEKDQVILPFAGPIYTKLNNPPVPNLWGVDSNHSWVRTNIERRLLEFTDVTPTEQRFFVLINTFLSERRNRVVGRCHMAPTMQRFIDENGKRIVAENLMLSWTCHCVALERSGFISNTQMQELILALAKYSRKRIASRSPLKSQPGCSKRCH